MVSDRSHHSPNGAPNMPATQSDVDRFRSFAERYVIERASKFRDDDPRRDAWIAVQDALSMYNAIAQSAFHHFGPVNRDAVAGSAQQAGATQPAPKSFPFAEQVVKEMLAGHPKWEPGSIYSPTDKEREREFIGTLITKALKTHVSPSIAQPLVDRWKQLTGQLRGANNATQTQKDTKEAV